MLEPLFESKIKENILLYLFINNMSYPRLDRVYDFLNDEVKEKYYIKRTRPRKIGKPL